MRLPFERSTVLHAQRRGYRIFYLSYSHGPYTLWCPGQHPGQSPPGHDHLGQNPTYKAPSDKPPGQNRPDKTPPTKSFEHNPPGNPPPPGQNFPPE